MRVAILTAVLGLVVADCSNERIRARDVPAAPTIPAPSAPTGTPPAPTPIVAGFTVHEWGLFGLVAEAPLPATVAPDPERDPPGVLLGSELGERMGPSGLGRRGPVGSPVIHLHLDEGVDRLTTDLDVRLGPGDSILERWPGGEVASERLRFGSITATRGACTAASPPPSADGAACRTADGFCQAAEVQRYAADRDVCLAVGAERSELLFYRASRAEPLDTPYSLAYQGRDLVVRRSAAAAIEGPLLYVDRSRGRTARILRLDAATAGGPVARLRGIAIDVAAARGLLQGFARAHGLTDLEAQAFVDAGTPTIFGTTRERNTVSGGRPPAGLGDARRSLIYFAPRAMIDAALPLATTPAARETHRVFLVRSVEGDPPPRAARFDPGEEQSLDTRYGSPLVRIAAPSIQGALTSAQVDRVVRRNLAQVVHCHEQGLSRDPTLEGRVVVRFVVSRTGAVASSAVATSSLGDASVASCIVTATRRWTFPEPDGESIAVVTLPFVLTLQYRPR